MSVAMTEGYVFSKAISVTYASASAPKMSPNSSSFSINSGRIFGYPADPDKKQHEVMPTED